jgi:hypothetical protein
MASSLLDRVKRQPQSAETFIAAAEAAPMSAPASANIDAATIKTDAPATMPPAAIPEHPNKTSRGQHAQSEDPRKHDVPRYTFNLRLNDYELELLRSLADEQRDSMQKIVKAGLIPYLEGLRKAGKKTTPP